jgi:NADPH:quinone reductase-like Zn-dependent oxidoreductase
VRDVAKHEEVAALGAAEVVDPGAVAEHGPYDVVLELVGAASLPSALEALATRGRVVVIGVGSGAVVEVDFMALMGRRARISASSLRARPGGEKAVLIATLGAQVVPAFADRRLRVPLAATFALRDAAAAYARFSTGGKLGKIVLTG